MSETTHLTWTNDSTNGDLVFSGRIAQYDLVRVQLDGVDLSVVTSPIKSPADFAQNIEIIFRRLEQQVRHE